LSRQESTQRNAPPGSATAHPAAALAHELASGGPPKGRPCPCGGRSRSLSCPLRARASSALGARLDQGDPKKALHIKPLTSNVRRPGLRLCPSLSLSKGDKKTKIPRSGPTSLSSLHCPVSLDTFAGAAIHWIAAYYPARPSALGSAKGVNKNQSNARSSSTGVETVLGCILFCFGTPLLKPREEGERSASTKLRGTDPRVRPRHRDVPWANLLSRPTSEGTRGVCGRRVRGALSFGSLLWARKERNPSYGGG
jgi:hypothetical protein